MNHIVGLRRQSFASPRFSQQIDGPDHEFLRVVTGLIPALPIRIVALYLIVQSHDGSSSTGRHPASPLWMKAVELITMITTSFIRVRTRILYGSYVENIYNLMCLGIAPKLIPIDCNGNPKTDILRYYIQQRRIYESTNTIRHLQIQHMNVNHHQPPPPPLPPPYHTVDNDGTGDNETHMILDFE